MMMKKWLVVWVVLSVCVAGASRADVGERNARCTIPVLGTLLLSGGHGVALVRSIGEKYADDYNSRLVPADQQAIASFVETFPEGSEPAAVSGYGNTLSITITSRSSAFFLVGVQAVAQDSKVAALWCFAEAVARNPENPVYANSLAFELIEAGQLADAERILRWILAKVPDFSEAMVNLAFILGKNGRHLEAAELYHYAFYVDYTNSYAVYASAREYMAAGENGQAWMMAGLGQDTFPTEYDFAGLLPRIDYTTNLEDGQCAGACTGQECLDVLNAYLLETNDANEKNSTYEGDVYDPAVLTADQTRYTREQEAMEHLRGCDQYYSPQFEICRCESWIAHDSASPGRYASWYNAEGMRQGVIMDNHEVKWKDIWAYYAQQKETLSVDERNYLICYLESQQLNEERAIVERGRIELGDLLASLQNARHNLSVTSQTYCQESQFYDWFFTIEFVESVEPKVCAGPVCFSKDIDSGDYGVEVDAGFAYKLTRNPHTGRGTMSIGLGFGVGISSFNFGAGAQVAMGGGKIGIIGKGSLGWQDVGFFVGFSHQQSNWSSYP